MAENCKISIITVVYNAPEDLIATIESVRIQKFKDFEYIVIDGGSIDNTVNVIEDNKNIIDYWVSERDFGIYDAMNKGINVSSGNILCFMNAGDKFYDENTLTIIYNRLVVEKDLSNTILYGNHVVSKKGVLFPKNASVKYQELWKGMIFCHQSSFVSRGLMEKYKFDKFLKIGADFKFFLQVKDSANFIYMDSFFSIVSSGGVSDNRRIKSVIERRNILSQLNMLTVSRNIYYYIEILNQFVKLTIKKILLR
ncbi:glycosyltransferase family 2 protein [Shewanella dokdonensis]|uniref:Glycosyltransferase n=1 Tax=Shewanella dokdonensis TaxID=712036 RepID=A0ABX8DGC1_9GAMM|nr:glycosyltransferase family 2 protein [Shewanella dokdonensis]MCL1073894.1 glycosyltransferase [Shewanella dokdonensis]QVK23671.1 glycosyltransferase [Shewanella dokdonensis]